MHNSWYLGILVLNGLTSNIFLAQKGQREDREYTRFPFVSRI
jgi:hypothetical protein